MKKKVFFSAKQDHDIIKDVIDKLKRNDDFDIFFHDPMRQFLDLEDIYNSFKDVDLFVVKVGNECSLDLLHFAKMHNIPSLHDINTVLLCKNKVALDSALRKAFRNHGNTLKTFRLPKSWTHSLLNVDLFKEWALKKLPIVIKSHYQHDKYNRFNFLVQNIDEVGDFCRMYSSFLYYNVYIQKFIECDGIDRKIYVIGDKVFGVKRENPIYIFLRENPKNIDVDTIEREDFEVSEEMKTLANILSKELNLKIFGFDLIKSINDKLYYLVDLNDFPGFRGINNIDNVLTDYLKEYFNFLDKK